MTQSEKRNLLVFCETIGSGIPKTNQAKNSIAAICDFIAAMEVESSEQIPMNLIPALLNDNVKCQAVAVQLKVERGCHSPREIEIYALNVIGDDSSQLRLERPAARELVRQILQQLNSNP